MIAVTEARALINSNLPGPVARKTALEDAAGMILAEDVYGLCDIPAFTQSSMDGYAFIFGNREKTMPVVGEMAAGTSTRLRVTGNQAVRVFTGAPLPEGADTVVMQEKVNLANGILEIGDAAIKEGEHVRPQGAEVKKGALVMRRGEKLTPAAVGYLAGAGYAEVIVFRTPSVGVILTGDELQQPGTELAFGQVYESNSYALRTALLTNGFREVTVSRVKDDSAALGKTLEEALAAYDVVLLTGGVSVGAYDFVVEAAGKCGVKTVFHKIRQKPGKPLYFGTYGPRLVFGLPGNPSSVLTCFYEYVLPALKRLAGHTGELHVTQATLAAGYSKMPGLTHFLKGWYENGQATPLNAQESYRMSSFARANCFICLGEERGTCGAGETVEVHLLPDENNR